MQTIIKPISTTIYPDKTEKGSMRQQHPYSTIWEKKMVVILCYYGARDILLLFCYHQGTESQ